MHLVSYVTVIKMHKLLKDSFHKMSTSIHLLIYTGAFGLNYLLYFTLQYGKLIAFLSEVMKKNN